MILRESSATRILFYSQFGVLAVSQLLSNRGRNKNIYIFNALLK